MRLGRLTASGAAGLALLALLALPAEAQRLPQYARATVEAPQVLARGGAGVALPSLESALFYNPAHFAAVGAARPRIDLFAVQAGMSGNFPGNLRFLINEVAPAVEDGITLPLSPANRALFDEALDRGARPTVAQAAAAVPVVSFPTPMGGVGGGFFATNTTRMRFEDVGGGMPLLDFFSQVDLIAAAGGAVRIPDFPLSLGLTTRLARRYIGSKYRELVAMDRFEEQVLVISGTSLAVDFGLHARDALPDVPGELSFGFAVYDLLGGGFNYGFDRAYALTGTGPVNQQELARILESFEDRDGRISVRTGLAYHFPLPPLADAAVTVDWVSASTSESRQPFAAGLRFGAEASLAERITVRAGYSQGYPAGGIGFRLPGVRLDYSLYGVEDGRVPGQLGRYQHVIQIRAGF